MASHAKSATGKTLQLGILNLMPEPEVYQAELQDLFAPERDNLSMHWMLPQNSKYLQGRDAAPRGYTTFQQLTSQVKLDALIVTGAPVEHLEFERVSYWEELQQIFQYSLAHECALFGICWGALALGKFIGIDKRRLPEKYFGIHELKTLAPDHGLTRTMPASYFWPFSTHAWFEETSVQRLINAGKLVALAKTADLDFALLASADGRVTLCLGHPEYPLKRLRAEWQRDNPNSAATLGTQTGPSSWPDGNHWRADAEKLFASWFCTASGKRAARHNKVSPPIRA